MAHLFSLLVQTTLKREIHFPLTCFLVYLQKNFGEKLKKIYIFTELAIRAVLYAVNMEKSICLK